jgi:hypothetical protein
MAINIILNLTFIKTLYNCYLQFIFLATYFIRAAKIGKLYY